jgi:hypothetical protein
MKIRLGLIEWGESPVAKGHYFYHVGATFNWAWDDWGLRLETVYCDGPIRLLVIGPLWISWETPWTKEGRG